MVQKSFSGREVYEVVDKKIIASYGCFKKVHYWIEGWHSELAQYGCILFIFGLSGGKETELIREEIHAVGASFEVK